MTHSEIGDFSDVSLSDDECRKSRCAVSLTEDPSRYLESKPKFYNKLQELPTYDGQLPWNSTQDPPSGPKTRKKTSLFHLRNRNLQSPSPDIEVKRSKRHRSRFHLAKQLLSESSEETYDLCRTSESSIDAANPVDGTYHNRFYSNDLQTGGLSNVYNKYTNIPVTKFNSDNDVFSKTNCTFRSVNECFEARSLSSTPKSDCALTGASEELSESPHFLHNYLHSDISETCSERNSNNLYLTETHAKDFQYVREVSSVDFLRFHSSRNLFQANNEDLEDSVFTDSWLWPISSTVHHTFEDSMSPTRHTALRRASLESLLHSIYRGKNCHRRSSALDSDSLSESFLYQNGVFDPYKYGKTPAKWRERLLLTKDIAELLLMGKSLSALLTSFSSLLLKELKKRDKYLHSNHKQYDVVTAILHALSPKRRQDTRMRFSVEPFAGDSGFHQWHDAMKMCARLPGGIPQEFRRRMWLTLAEQHVRRRNIQWKEVERACFSEWASPDDEGLGDQIVKDLHRTGCSLFCGEDAEVNQALLKKVLLGYARWNKTVGYCQGFNMLAAIILEVMDRQESDALKVMVYLIEGVLPESYFANNLRGLSVDMAVLRELLRIHLPRLSRHLEILQTEAADQATGACYEPPLTNVFTMQWFLTLFSNCLPRDAVMRVWDLTFLQGNEVLIRTALAIWGRLSNRIMEVPSADEFYCVMGDLTRDMLTHGLMDANQLVQTLVGMAPFPFPGLAALRDKYTYNITPWTMSSVARKGLKIFYLDDDDDEDERAEPDDVQHKMVVATAFGLAGILRKTSVAMSGQQDGRTSPCHISQIARPNLDISALKKQYARLRERQKQAHIILTGSNIRRRSIDEISKLQPSLQKTNQLTMKHLLRGKKALTTKTKRVVPQGVIPNIITKKKVERKCSETSLTKSRAGKQSSGRPPSTIKTVKVGQKAETVPAALSTPRQNLAPKLSLPEEKKMVSKTDDLPSSAETLHWKDTPRRVNRRASLPYGVKLMEGGTSVSLPNIKDDDDADNDDGSSTSTELCDDDLEDLSEEESLYVESLPRPVSTSPRLENRMKALPEEQLAMLIKDVSRPLTLFPGIKPPQIPEESLPLTDTGQSEPQQMTSVDQQETEIESNILNHIDESSPPVKEKIKTPKDLQIPFIMESLAQSDSLGSLSKCSSSSPTKWKWSFSEIENPDLIQPISPILTLHNFTSVEETILEESTSPQVVTDSVQEDIEADEQPFTTHHVSDVFAYLFEITDVTKLSNVNSEEPSPEYDYKVRVSPLNSDLMESKVINFNEPITADYEDTLTSTKIITEITATNTDNGVIPISTDSVAVSNDNNSVCLKVHPTPDEETLDIRLRDKDISVRLATIEYDNLYTKEERDVRTSLELNNTVELPVCISSNLENVATLANFNIDTSTVIENKEFLTHDLSDTCCNTHNLSVSEEHPLYNSHPTLSAEFSSRLESPISTLGSRLESPISTLGSRLESPISTLGNKIESPISTFGNTEPQVADKTVTATLLFDENKTEQPSPVQMPNVSVDINETPDLTKNRRESDYCKDDASEVKKLTLVKDIQLPIASVYGTDLQDMKSMYEDGNSEDISESQETKHSMESDRSLDSDSQTVEYEDYRENFPFGKKRDISSLSENNLALDYPINRDTNDFNIELLSDSKNSRNLPSLKDTHKSKSLDHETYLGSTKFEIIKSDVDIMLAEESLVGGTDSTVSDVSLERFFQYTPDEASTDSDISSENIDRKSYFSGVLKSFSAESVKQDMNESTSESEKATANGLDIEDTAASEVIRRKLWAGVKSLSLDAQVLISTSKADKRSFIDISGSVLPKLEESPLEGFKESRSENFSSENSDPELGAVMRRLPRRKSEAALELMKENTKIIDKILNQRYDDDIDSGSLYVKQTEPNSGPEARQFLTRKASSDHSIADSSSNGNVHFSLIETNVKSSGKVAYVTESQLSNSDSQSFTKGTEFQVNLNQADLSIEKQTCFRSTPSEMLPETSSDLHTNTESYYTRTCLPNIPIGVKKLSTEIDPPTSSVSERQSPNSIKLGTDFSTANEYGTIVNEYQHSNNRKTLGKTLFAVNLEREPVFRNQYCNLEPLHSVSVTSEEVSPQKNSPDMPSSASNILDTSSISPQKPGADETCKFLQDQLHLGSRPLLTSKYFSSILVPVASNISSTVVATINSEQSTPSSIIGPENCKNLEPKKDSNVKSRTVPFSKLSKLSTKSLHKTEVSSKQLFNQVTTVQMTLEKPVSDDVSASKRDPKTSPSRSPKFNPFPTTPLDRPPKEVTVKLGLYTTVKPST